MGTPSSRRRGGAKGKPPAQQRHGFDSAAVGARRPTLPRIDRRCRGAGSLVPSGRGLPVLRRPIELRAWAEAGGRPVREDDWEKDTKNEGDRRIVLDPDTVLVLSEHRERCVMRARALGLELASDAFVFSRDPVGRDPLKPDSVTQRYSRLVTRLGIATSIHKLRTYNATELSAGLDIRRAVPPQSLELEVRRLGALIATLRTG
jgi:hypothetical protein